MRCASRSVGSLEPLTLCSTPTSCFTLLSSLLLPFTTRSAHTSALCHECMHLHGRSGGILVHLVASETWTRAEGIAVVITAQSICMT